ncbi:2-C-methyl-D-erythritol 4-phosphate cytidylyltransferase [Bacillus marinisedimentorum]|uniref:2-C-methyl-D-erythritol 4-phosphate cytidylyltransferase n=1 Tax=Bacillus marinisedimentorum TaxID=1821260 RepID=UPI000872B5E0|nr:2-C-methyl-D-erythritol 4-phosphate cytidylyltransferase [Bacillus marinisedimentorum]
MKYSVVIPAAGRGKRMNAGKNKLFIDMNGEPVIAYTMKVFDREPDCTEIILAVHKEEMGEFKKMISRIGFETEIKLAEGGKERQDSVYNGLKKTTGDIILVHDGARPFITGNMVGRLAEAAAEHGAAIAAVPVKDTIKKAEAGFVTETVDRSTLMTVQTPQAFRRDLILKAHEHARQTSFVGTDDSSLAELLGFPVKIIEGSYRNIKLTTPEDLIFAEAILAQ